MLRTAMSENLAAVLAGYEAWNRDDLDGWLERLHPDAELQTAGVFPDIDPVYRGHDQIAEFWRQLHAPWEVFRIDIEQIEEEGDCFTLAIRFRGKGVDSGVEVDLQFGNALRLRHGRATEIVTRRTAAEAREALRRRQRATPSRQR
jgi:ketosteroid isomerase-like protein